MYKKINYPTQLKNGLKQPIPKQTYNILKNITINNVKHYDNKVLLIKRVIQQICRRSSSLTTKIEYHLLLLELL